MFVSCALSLQLSISMKFYSDLQKYGADEVMFMLQVLLLACVFICMLYNVYVRLYLDKKVNSAWLWQWSTSQTPLDFQFWLVTFPLLLAVLTTKIIEANFLINCKRYIQAIWQGVKCEKGHRLCGQHTGLCRKLNS